jgi:hypothetical protein
MRPLNFGSPTDLKNLLAAELTAGRRWRKGRATACRSTGL